MERSSVRSVRHAVWWLAPLFVIWLFGMWMVTLYLQAGEPAWAVAVMLAGNIVTFGISAVIGIRRPEVRIGQLLTLATAGFAISPFLLDEIEPFMASWLVDLVIIAGTPLSVVAGGAISWVVLLFPTGHHLSRRWMWVSWLLGSLVAVGTPLMTAWFLNDQFNTALPQLDDIFFVVVTVPFVAALVSLFFRYREGDTEVKAQLRWLMLAVATYVVFLVVVSSTLEESIISAALDQIFYVGIPIGIGIAVFRYRLYEIDRLISRTITYTIVVGLLAATYLGVVTLVTAVLPTQNSLAVAGSTLAVAALFNPLRRRIQSVADRRFNRSRYEADIVAEQFSFQLQDSLTLNQLADVWVETVDRHLEPEAVVVWLKDT